jgi:SSS family solute:Na+ symporter
VPVSLGILALIYLFLIHIGLAMRVLVPAIPDPVSTDGIFIRLINHELYGPLSALFFFSVIGACISTANSQLLLVASSFAYDILRAAKKEELTGHQTVRIARYTVVAAGTLSMILTLNPPAFTLSYGGDIWGIVGIFMFPLLYLPLVRKGITVRGAWHCVITGALAAAITYPLYYAGVLKIHPALPSIICSSVALLAGSGRNPKNLLPEKRGDSDGG